MERHAFLHRRTATTIYNFANSFGGGKAITEQAFWPLDLDKETQELTFEEYIKGKIEQNLPDDHFAEIFKTALKLESHV